MRYGISTIEVKLHLILPPSRSQISSCNGDQIIDVNGVIAEPDETLNTLSQFELSNLNALVTGNTVLLDGQISANGKLRDLY